MWYGTTSDATDWSPPDRKEKAIKLALFFVPEANPDADRLFQYVKKWVVEVDDDGMTAREVALDATGAPVFRAPDDRNLGFWVDSDRKFTESDLQTVTKAEFEALWDQASEWKKQSRTRRSRERG